MEPVSIGFGALIWKVAIEPVINSYQESYGDLVKGNINKLLSKAFEKLPFSRKEIELIETEIVDSDISVFKDKEKFLDFIENNQKVTNILKEVTKREPNINVIIEKSYNNISMNGNNNSINF